MEIPYTRLRPETLDKIIEYFVSRDGVDSGHVDRTMEEKTALVKKQLEMGRAFIFYDKKTDSCNILSRDEIKQNNI